MESFLIIQDIPEQHTAKARNQKLHKTAILGTARILQEVLRVIKTKKERKCIPIFVAIPADRNLERKESEDKILQEFIHRDIMNVE